MTDQPFEFEIWDNEAIRAIQAAKPIVEQEFAVTDMVEIDRLLTACCMAIQSREDRPHPKQIKAQLTGLQNSYGCWLDSVRSAILEAEIDDEDRRELYGAFCMADAFL